MLSGEDNHALKGNEKYHDDFDKYRDEGAIARLKVFFALKCELNLLAEQVLGLKEVMQFVKKTIIVLLSECF